MIVVLFFFVAAINVVMLNLLRKGCGLEVSDETFKQVFK